MTNPRGFSDVDRQDDASGYVLLLEAQDREPSTMRVRAAALDMLDPRPGMRVLDVGCGIGTAAREIAARVVPGGSVVAVDLSERMLQIARERAATVPGLEFRTGDATSLQFEDGSFDAVRSERVLQHIASPEQAFAEMVRVVRPGGRIVIADTDWDSLAVDLPDVALATKLRAAWLARFASPVVGRRLYGMAVRAGLQDVRVEAIPLLILDVVLPGSDVRPADLMVNQAVEGGSLTGEEGEEISRLLAQAEREGAFLMTFVMYVVGAVVP